MSRTDISPVVERVARAIAYKHFDRKPTHGHCTHEELVSFMANKYWRDWVSDARAAIEAMREPTPEMVDAPVDRETMGAYETELCWRTMIAEALGDPSPSGQITP